MSKHQASQQPENQHPGNQQPCPCGGMPSGAEFNTCCGPALAGEIWPETAEALMRSRYTAFVRGAGDHIFRTWHPRTRPADTTPDAVTWLGLDIIDVVDGTAQDDEGVVEFIARFADPSQPNGVSQLRERSRFARRASRWMYLAAEG